MVKIVSVICILVLLWGCSPMPRYTVLQKPKYKTYGDSESTEKTLKEFDRLEVGTKIRGMASYYADDFHGKKTANGETFDMHGLTAAHKTLEFNTWLEVKNLSNDRTVLVRVNDRGPFVGNRILDLSLGAAKAIGMIESGVQEVEITIIKNPD